jgi:16S rRNA (cytosine1402-N4)-methyltransferase
VSTAPRTTHVPILLAPIVEGLLEPLRALPATAAPEWIVDCTLGGGGHTFGLLSAIATSPALARHRVLSVDQDRSAIERGRQRFAAEIAAGRLELLHARFSEISGALEGRVVAGLMADLGFSSDQIDDPSRGLSFQGDGPLDMRLDPERGEPVSSLLRTLREEEIADILYQYGDERFSRRIAHGIKLRLSEGPILTTQELVRTVVRSLPAHARHGKIHAATRTFQALRIAVNDELNELETLLSRVILSVRPKGRVAILSFHSLEDRRVKNAFRDEEGAFEPIHKKPIEASEEEVEKNPRARSAKLRIAERSK